MTLKVSLKTKPKLGFKVGILGLLLIMIFNSAWVWGEDNQLIFLTNKYVKIFINASPEETGRFAVDVSAGDPNREDDDNKPLIYGHPMPWTSFTTIRINGQNFVFGKATAKRPGAGVPGGEIVKPPSLVKDQLTMTCKYGTVMVEQILDITRSPSTGLLDTARIKYIIKNEGTEPAEIGLRTAFDTMVGDNDGAPFRAGEKEITYEYEMGPSEYPDFWQAFDSLDKPSVIAQGTLRGGDVTPPDKLVFTNWGKAADNPWDIAVHPGTEFLRLGEEELDSSVVMYWQPRTVQPKEQMKVVIYYGLGGVTFAPGQTFLGISAPSELQYAGDNTRNYSIVMYMEHRGEATARNVQVSLDLPAGLEVVRGEPVINLDEMIPGVTHQFAWDIKPTGLYLGDASFQIRVNGEGLEPNEVFRPIRIIPPPYLGATIAIPKLKVVNNLWKPNPLSISLKLKNLDDLTAMDLKASIKCDSGLELASGDRIERIIGELDNQGQATVSWNITPLRGSKTGKFTILVNGANIIPMQIPGEISIPRLPAVITFTDPGKLRSGQVFCCDLIGYNLEDAVEFSADIAYDSKNFRLVYISRGTMLVEDEQFSNWSDGKMDSKNGTVKRIYGKRSRPLEIQKATLFRLNFVVVGNGGSGKVDLTNIKILNSQGEVIPYEFTAVNYQIEEEK